MADRLAELQRQRALVSEHLAWLDREIGALQAAADTPARAAPPSPDARADPVPSTALPAPQTPAVSVTGEPVVPAVAPSLAAAAAEEIMEEYRVPPTTLQSDVRKGCLIYFAAALVLLAFVVLALYFTIGSR